MEILKAPKDRVENLKFRINLVDKAKNNPELQAILRAQCKKDFVFFVDAWCYTRNPRLPEIPNLPFILYDYQEIIAIRDIIPAIRDQHDILLEKTRDMGASWLVLLCFLWLFMFYDGCDFKVGSWKEMFVDKIDDMDSLMEKYRFVLKRMPKWMRGDLDPAFPFMRFPNPENSNSIIGETASQHFGSGGRRKAIFLDEYAKWENTASEGAYTATADVTGCRIFNSTPFGSGNKYAKLANESNIKVITMHWTLHPEKNKGCYYLDLITGDHIPIDVSDGGWRALEIWKKFRGEILPASFGLRGGVVRSTWYDAECIRRDDDQDIAQELDIDYKRSGAPFFDMVALNEQREWKWIELQDQDSRIPYGRYITGDLVMVNHKVQFRQKEESRGGWLRLFEQRDKGLVYAIGGDTCEGLPKGDENSLVVRDAINRNVIATACNKQRPEEFAYQCWLVHKYFNECKTGVENNNHGYSVNKDLDELGTNLYYTKKYEGKDGDEETTKRGFSTNGKTRIMALDKLAHEIKTKSVELRDSRIINQCKTFVRPEKKPQHPEADGDFKDDCVMATAISSVVIDEEPKKVNSKATESKKASIRDEIIKRRKIKIRR